MDNSSAKYQRAKQRVDEERGFYSHLVSYIAVNLGLFLLFLYTGSDYHWYVWPLAGWGIGLLSHWWSVFGSRNTFGESWESRRIKQLMEQDFGPE